LVRGAELSILTLTQYILLPIFYRTKIRYLLITQQPQQGIKIHSNNHSLKHRKGNRTNKKEEFPAERNSGTEKNKKIPAHEAGSFVARKLVKK